MKIALKFFHCLILKCRLSQAELLQVHKNKQRQCQKSENSDVLKGGMVITKITGIVALVVTIPPFNITSLFSDYWYCSCY